MATETITALVGGNVRAEMGRQRVTMVELARRTGIPRATLRQQINAGRLTVDSLVAVAKALNVAPAALLPAEPAEAVS